MNALKVWATGLVALAAGTTGAWAVDAAQGQENESARREAAARVHFYRVVAGEDAGRSPTVDNKLARDLHVLLEKDDAAGAIADFRGDANRYGGITEELGFDPFNGENCSECGELDLDVQEDLLQIEKGDLDEVVAEQNAGLGDDGSIKEEGLIATIGWLLTLPLWLAYPSWRERRHTAKLRRQFPEECRMIDEAKALYRRDAFYDHAKGKELERLINGLEQTIVQKSKRGENMIADRRFNDLSAEMKATLEAHREAERELGY